MSFNHQFSSKQITINRRINIMDFNIRNRKDRGWDGNQTFELILKYIESPELWNKTVLEFKDRDRKAASLRKIAKYFNTDKDEIARKLHNLRCQMYREMRNMKRCKQEGTIFYTTWRYFDLMKLTIVQTVWKRLTDGLVIERSSPPVAISPTIEIKSEIEVDNDSDAYDDEDDGSCETLMPIGHIFEDDGSCETPISIDHTLDVRQNFSNSNSFNIKSDRESNVEYQHAMDASLNEPKAENYYQVFGNYVTAELRNLKSDVSRRRLIRIIQKAILDIGEADDQLDLNTPASTT